MKKNNVDPAKQLEKIEKAKNVFLKQIKGINRFSEKRLPFVLTEVLNAIHPCFDFAELKKFCRPKKNELGEAMCLYVVNMGNRRLVEFHCYVERQMTYNYTPDGEWEYKLYLVMADNIERTPFFSKEVILTKLYLSKAPRKLWQKRR
ncbi:MAG: hypothetical protein WCO66_04810 [Candidatus Absconditabacteria bacterium]